MLLVRQLRPQMMQNEDLVVPLVDEQEAGRIYDRSLTLWALVGAWIGMLVVGWVGYALAAGELPVAGLGQWAGSGATGGAIAGGGLGVAVGGLAGALLALYRMPARTPQAAGED